MSLRSLRALCLTSFFIADVRDGLGPFLGIFLTQRHWTPDDIGLLMTAGGLAGLLATLPAGFITDTTKKQTFRSGAALFTDHPEYAAALV
ncbi:major facilitator transporter [Enterobacter cloacae]|uniref:Major facilitator transporter n=1 Tax=Enterobacter cloacae TaxID=550 RepID=A0A377M2I6_ENTCL|nr:major facilitator transporter [Enterobacter cloacae]